MINNKIGGGILSLESFFSYINQEFFTPQFSKFENINITPENFKLLVFAFYFAFLFATAIIYYNRVVLGSLPRALIANNCISPESAKTFSELGYKNNPFIMLSLSFGTTLSRIVKCVEGEIWTKNPANTHRSKLAWLFLPEKRYKINFKTDKFYVPEEKRDVCEIRFAKKGNGLLALALSAVGGLIVVILIIKFSPMLLEFIDGIIGGIAGGNNDILN